MDDKKELVVVEGHGITLFRTDDPVTVIEQARRIAQPLAALVEERQLYVTIENKKRGTVSKHVKIEGWTLLGSMLGVFPVTVWTRELADRAGWEARVEARTRAGEIVGAAEAECRYDEPNWDGRPSYALKSMAQTRASSKALRMPLGFVMEMGGFAATPAEEMEGIIEAEAVGYAGPPCPNCGAPVVDQRETAGPRQPKWKCSNWDCGGGSLKDKNDPSKGHWPWASWDENPWEETPEGAEDRDDLVEQMYRSVQRTVAVDRDTAESLVMEAADHLGFIWPDPLLGADAAEEIFARATADKPAAQPAGDAVAAFASASLLELQGATIREQKARIDMLPGFPKGKPATKAEWQAETARAHGWAREFRDKSRSEKETLQ